MNREDSKLWRYLVKALDGTSRQSGRKPMYHTKYWINIRSAVLTRDHNECQVCAEMGKVRQAEVVHHIKPVEDFPDRFDDLSNLVSLCRECHETLHGRGEAEDEWPELS